MFKPAPSGMPWNDPEWQTTTWKADDSAFRAMRKRIEAMPDAQLRQEVARLDAKKTLDPDELFRWGLGGIELASENYDYARFFEGRASARMRAQYFFNGTHRTSYEYTRMRWLVCTRFITPHHSLLAMGVQLLKREPNDLHLLRRVVHMHQPQFWKEDLRPGLQFAERLEKLSPESVSSMAVLGRFYELAFEATGRRVYADRSLLFQQRIIQRSRFPRQREVARMVADEIRKKRDKGG